MKPLPDPNMKAKPNAQNNSPQMQVSTIPSRMMLTDSLERAKPASRHMNPACMKKTRNAAMRVQAVLIGLMYGGGGGVPAADAGAKNVAQTAVMIAKSATRPSAFPSITAANVRRNSFSFTRRNRCGSMTEHP